MFSFLKLKISAAAASAFLVRAPCPFLFFIPFADPPGRISARHVRGRRYVPDSIPPPEEEKEREIERYIAC